MISTVNLVYITWHLSWGATPRSSSSRSFLRTSLCPAVQWLADFSVAKMIDIDGDSSSKTNESVGIEDLQERAEKLRFMFMSSFIVLTTIYFLARKLKS